MKIKVFRIRLNEINFLNDQNLVQPPFMVCHNSELMTVGKTNPQSFEDLPKIKGFGQQKISKFGDDILALLNWI